MPDPTRATSAVFIDGKIVPITEASVSLSDQGLLYGFGFFETFRTSGGRPHHWRFNRARLDEACVRSRISLPTSFLGVDEPRLWKAVGMLLQAVQQADGVFRYTVTAGDGVSPTEFLTVRPLPVQPGVDGISLRVLNVQRDLGEWIPRPKSLNYLNAALGLQELRRRNVAPTDEGLFLSRDDAFVVETPRQSIAWIREGRIYSPAEAVGGVAGTCLAWMLSRGAKIQPARASLTEFMAAEAIFVCNSVRGVSPVREIWNQSDSRSAGELRLCSASAGHAIAAGLAGFTDYDC